MAYEATAWKKGDKITSERLNKMEQGIKNEQVGPKGATGAAGKDGAQGPKGETGAAGKAGTNGAKGVDGKSVTAMTLTSKDGKITGGEATLTGGTKLPITISES